MKQRTKQKVFLVLRYYDGTCVVEGVHATETGAVVAALRLKKLMGDLPSVSVHVIEKSVQGSQIIGEIADNSLLIKTFK